MEFNAAVTQVRGLAAIKSGLIHDFLPRKIPVQIQEHHSFYPFVWWVCGFESIIFCQ